MLADWPRKSIYDRGTNRLQLVLRSLRKIEISGWDTGLKVSSPGHGQEFLALPSLNVQLILPDYPEPVARPITEFSHHIPSPIWEQAAPFRWKQLTLLQLCSRSPQVVELLQSLPMLAWMLANATDASIGGLKASCELTAQKRVRILGAISGRGTKSRLRLLQKCLPQKHDFAELSALLSTLRSPQLTRALSHAERINLSALAAIIDCPDLAELSFVREELSSANASPHRLHMARMLLKGCKRFSGHYSRADFRQLLQRCRSFDDLRDRYNQLHDRFNLGLARQRGCVEQEDVRRAVLKQKVKEYEEHQQQHLQEIRRQQELERLRRQEQRHHARRLAEQRLEAAEQQALQGLAQQRGRHCAQDHAPAAKLRDLPFPSPPLPGNEYIQPLTSPRELEIEGQRMNNCVGDGGYHAMICNGERYIYRVLHPQRCTLEVKIGSSGRLSRGQLQTMGNGSASQATKRFVQDWLQSRQLQKDHKQPSTSPPRPIKPGQGSLLHN